MHNINDKNWFGATMEYWTLDVGFRELINGSDFEANGKVLETRTAILKVLGECDAAGWSLADTLAYLSTEPVSDIRNAVMSFLLKLQNETGVKGKPGYAMGAEDMLLKTRAKEKRARGDLKGALEMALSAIKKSPHLENNPGMLGFVMECYHDMRMPTKVLEYAQKILKIVAEDVRAIFYACVAATVLRLPKEALDYAEKGLGLNPNDQQFLRVAAYNANLLRDHHKALELAIAGLRIEENRTLLETAIYASFYLGDYERVVDYSRRLIPARRSSGIHALIKTASDRFFRNASSGRRV